jgi:uncharacterized phage protein gp47/JayE
MAGLTDQGFDIKRYDDVIGDMRDRAEELFGSGIDTSVNSLLGQIAQLSAVEMAIIWEEMQKVYDSFNPNAAAGKSLDDLASLVGVFRLGATSTSGYIEFKADNGTTVPRFTQVQQKDTKDLYQTTEQVTVSTNNAYSALLKITNVSNNTTYRITIDGAQVSYVTPSSGNTVTTLRDGLFDALDASIDYPDLTITSVSTDQIFVIHNTVTNTFALTKNSSHISTEEVETPIFVEAINVGQLSAPSESITVLSTPVSGVISVNNASSLIIGRLVETDDELRLRRAELQSSAGKATPEAIRKALLNIQGVSSAVVVENRTLTVDADGRPPKSYESVILGGANESLAETIWEFGPAGIETYGTSSEVIQDSNGDSHTIFFSRPTSLFITVDVTYSKYNEEIFPLNGEDAIRDAVLAYGDTLGLGEDVIPQRFFGDIFDAVSGIQSLIITVGSSYNENDTPALSSSPVSVPAREIPLFSTLRLTISEI